MKRTVSLRRMPMTSYTLDFRLCFVENMETRCSRKRMFFFNYLYLPQIFLNSEYRECDHRTYIVKEHYDSLKSSTSLSNQKTRNFLSEHGNDMQRIAEDMGSRCRLTRIGSTSCCLSAIGDGQWHQVCSTYDQNDHWVKSKYRKSNTKA